MRDSAWRILAAATGTAGAHGAVSYVLGRLGDGHSQLEQVHSAREGRPRLTTLGEASQFPASYELEPGIAYVEVPWYVTGITDGAKWERGLREGLLRRDQKNPCGWIVDLRRNPDGNMWPTLGGLAPLLPDGVAGGVAMTRRRSPVHWWIVGGRAYSAVPIAAGLDVVRGQRRLAHGSAPVAVLVGRQTASAGEAVAVAFIGLPMSRLLGDSTTGLSTANAAWRMEDGARLVVAVGLYVDRTGRRYERGVAPDELVATATGPKDAVLATAVKWLYGFPTCRALRQSG